MSSCNDSLGINGADYLKYQPAGDTLYIDTMINFKKVIIEKITTKTDTIINYIPVDRSYENIYSTKSDLRFSEYFDGPFGNPISEHFDKSAEIKVLSYLDYNPVTPLLSFKLTIDNSKSADESDSFEDRKLIINNFVINIKNFPVISDEPTPLNKIINDNDFVLSIELINSLGKKYFLRKELFIGEFVVSDRIVSNGQIRGLAMNGYIIIPQKDQDDLKRYSIEFRCFMNFPAF